MPPSKSAYPNRLVRLSSMTVRVESLTYAGLGWVLERTGLQHGIMKQAGLTEEDL